MKSLFLLLLSFFTFNSFSMERLSRLAALPVENEEELISFEQLPNPAFPAPHIPLRLWQSEYAQAQLQLPLVEANIRALEKKHDKEKKTFNEKREKVVDHAMYATGYTGLLFLFHKACNEHDLVFKINPFDLVKYFGKTLSPLKKETGSIGMARDFCAIAIATCAFLAAKNCAQFLWKSPNLIGAPKEPAELIKAREQRAELLLTLQQPGQAHEQSH